MLWAVAHSGRTADLEVCRQALELLWESGPPDLSRASELHDRLGDVMDEMPEDATGVESLVESGVGVLHTGVGLLLWGDPMGATQVSSAVRDFVLEVDPHGDAGLLAREDEAQNRDVADVLTRNDDVVEGLPLLCAAAAELGRTYLAAAVAAQGDSVELRVTAVLDRGDVSEANARTRFGVVGRFVAGDEAGRYVRADLMADLATTPEERVAADGVMIRIADDPDMTTDCIGEWLEDWAAVEETIEQRGWQIDWA
ncbi:hypothetical protein ACFYXH_03300 [Streptomyces sp. NPDC002730]|uniref:hypothetical protein n=1 Tax=Streptomyces sp. NPDC002730 TaxID=3364662 RepID=UPI0036BA9174